MRRRLRFVADLINSLLRSPARGESRAAEEERSADEVKRRLEKTRSRLKREHPPVQDDD